LAINTGETFNPKKVVTRADVKEFVYNHPETSIFKFDQVLNDVQNLKKKSGSLSIGRKVRTRSRISSISRDSGKKDYMHETRRTTFYDSMMLKQKL